MYRCCFRRKESGKKSHAICKCHFQIRLTRSSSLPSTSLAHATPSPSRLLVRVYPHLTVGTDLRLKRGRRSIGAVVNLDGPSVSSWALSVSVSECGALSVDDSINDTLLLLPRYTHPPESIQLITQFARDSAQPELFELRLPLAVVHVRCCCCCCWCAIFLYYTLYPLLMALIPPSIQWNTSILQLLAPQILLYWFCHPAAAAAGLQLTRLC